MQVAFPAGSLFRDSDPLGIRPPKTLWDSLLATCAARSPEWMEHPQGVATRCGVAEDRSAPMLEVSMLTLSPGCRYTDIGERFDLLCFT